MAGGQILQIAAQSLGRQRCELRPGGELWSVERLRGLAELVVVE